MGVSVPRNPREYPGLALDLALAQMRPRKAARPADQLCKETLLTISIPAALGNGWALAGVADEIATESGSHARKVLARTLNGASIPESRRHLVPRHPVDAIEETAAKVGCSIVVMGAISRSGLKRLVLGNTAERVFDDLSCDVLLVKPKRFATRVPRARRGPQLMALPVVEPVM